jgi:hypothetical protein
MLQDRPGLCPVQIATIVLGAAAGAFFGLAGAATWGNFDTAARAIMAALGVTAAGGAIACWAAGSRRESERHWQALIDVAREDRSLLIRTLADVAPAQRRPPTRPLPIRVR